jgi:FkbM family methyltransferase
MEEQHINGEFAVRMLEAPSALIDENDAAASNRLALLFDLIDFNSIKNICDIGSRFLEQTRELVYIFPDAQIYAFEPVPGSYKICCDNRDKLDAEYRDRISIFNVAVGEASKMIPFYPVNDTGSEFNVGASSKYKFLPGMNGSWWNKTWNQDEIQVPQVTLDEHRAKNNMGPIDLIWMDVQGGELDALKGAVETLKDVKVIMTEVGIGAYYDGQSLKPQIDEFVKAQGFRELKTGFKLNFQYEGDTIYIKEGLVDEDCLLP